MKSIRAEFEANKMETNSNKRARLVDIGFEVLRNMGTQVQQLQKQSFSSESVCSTKSVIVKAKSSFMPSFRGQDNKHIWGYEITITNSDPHKTFQLKSRQWFVKDDTGKVNETVGQGVVGKTPILPPGYSFKYESYVELETLSGTMEGNFTMEEVEKTQDNSFKTVSAPFRVKVAPFGLITTRENLTSKEHDTTKESVLTKESVSTPTTQQTTEKSDPV